MSSVPVTAHHADPRQIRSGPPTAVLVVLSAGPKSLPEIEDAFRAYGRRPPGDPRPRIARRAADDTKLADGVREAVDRAVEYGWAARHQGEGDRLWLTDAGRAEAERAITDRRYRRERVHRLLQPSAASRTTMVAQVAITAIKVPAALISGSAAQLNDSAEELLDIVASASVYLGIRARREQVANIIVVVLMLGTGLFTVAFALRRFFAPVTPTLSWYPFSVAVVSVPFYAVRSAYERSSGLRGHSAALVAQSVDSRNHAITGVGVTAGLIAASLGAPVVDTIFGLGVALTILKSCAYLTRDLVRSMRQGEPPEMARYSTWVGDDLERVLQHRLQTWLLYLVGTEHITIRSNLVRRAQQAADPESNPLLEFGMEVDARRLVEPALGDLIQHELLSDTDPLEITDRGRRELQRTMRRRL